jgi:hypothetical protein
LSSAGYAADDVAAARALGLTDADIEAERQATLDTSPDELAGDVLDKLRDAAAAMAEAGSALGQPVNFVSEPDREAWYGGGLLAAGFAAAAEPDKLARVYDQTSTVLVGNPLDHAAVIDMRIRPISVPAAWIVDVSPARLELGPGEQANVTVRITPTTPVAQGTLAQVAVEGYAEGGLLGGVVVAVLIPKYMVFGATPGGDGPPLLVMAGGAVLGLLLFGAIVAFVTLRRSRATRSQTS